MAEKLGILYFVLILIGAIRLFIRAARKEQQEDADDFAYLTVREQLAEAQATSDALGEAEQLITDMQESCEDDVMILHIDWIGRDDEQHTLELYCDGSDTASECMTEIAEREVHDLQIILARQCAMLAEEGRHRQNHRQNERIAGEGSSNGEILPVLRS